MNGGQTGILHVYLWIVNWCHCHCDDIPSCWNWGSPNSGLEMKAWVQIVCLGYNSLKQQWWRGENGRKSNIMLCYQGQYKKFGEKNKNSYSWSVGFSITETSWGGREALLELSAETRKWEPLYTSSCSALAQDHLGATTLHPGFIAQWSSALGIQVWWMIFGAFAWGMVFYPKRVCACTELFLRAAVPRGCGTDHQSFWSFVPMCVPKKNIPQIAAFRSSVL